MADGGRTQDGDYAKGSVAGRLRQCILPLPPGPDPERQEVSDEDVRQALEKGSAAAASVLEDVRQVLASRDERGRAFEARATTLLGTVPIAASLVIAGAGLILDEGKVKGEWNLLIATVECSVLIMGLVALLLILLLMCGFTASRAVLKARIEVTTQPRIRQALNWAERGAAQDVQVERVTELVRRARESRYVAEYKRAQLKVAYYWYRAALACFGVLGVVLFAYAALR